MQRERRTIWSMVRMMLWTLSAVALVACIREEFIDDPDAPDAPETAIQAGNYDLYFRVLYDAANPQTRVSGSSGEDSGDLVEGSHNEHEIGQNGNFALLFFDNPNAGATGNDCYVLRDVLPLSLQEEWSDSEDDTEIPKIPPKEEEPDKGKVETIFRSRINVSPGDLPKKCLVILNGLPLYEKLIALRNEQATLGTVLGMTWDDYENPRNIGRDGDRFVMTNSAYFTEKGLQVATDLGDLDLDQYLWVEGDDNSNKLAVRIYVERMVAKFTFSVEADAGKYGTSDYIVPLDDGTYYIYPQKIEGVNYEDRNYDEIWVFTGFDEDGIQKVAKRKWRVHVTGWGINALETSSYVFKNVPDASDMNAYNFGSWIWNRADLYRSYWAEDPHYSKDRWLSYYPWQYRDALDDSSLPPSYSWRVGEAKLPHEPIDRPILRNEDYEYFSNDQRGIDEHVVYAPENTYDYIASMSNASSYASALDNREHLLAGTHLLVCAELQVQDQNGDYKTFTGYRDRIGNFYWGKLNPTSVNTEEPWKSTKQAEWDPAKQDKDTETQNNTRNCFIRLMRTFNYYLSSQKEMYYRYYQWPKKDNSLEPKPGDINLGDEFYAKPESSPSANSDPDVISHVYEICLENTNGYVTRLFNNKNEYLIEDDENIEAEDKALFEYFVPARVKDGDGKVLPWLKENDNYTLRIFDIVKKKDANGNEITVIENAQIPVYKYSDTDIDQMVNDWMAIIQGYWDKKKEEDDTEWEAYKKRYEEERGKSLDWVQNDVNFEVFSAIERDDYRGRLLGGVDPEALETHDVGVNDRRSMLFDWLNTVDYFEDGMMYYAMEIKNPAAAGDTAYKNSPYGVVRNNWYKFNLRAINTIGTSISEHGERIVPNRLTTNDQTTFDVRIIGWEDIHMGDDIHLPTAKTAR